MFPSLDSTLTWQELCQKKPTTALRWLCEIARDDPSKNDEIVSLAQSLCKNPGIYVFRLYFGQQCLEVMVRDRILITDYSFKKCDIPDCKECIENLDKNVLYWQILRLVDYAELRLILDRELVEPKVRLQAEEACLAATGLTLW